MYITCIWLLKIQIKSLPDHTIWYLVHHKRGVYHCLLDILYITNLIQLRMTDISEAKTWTILQSIASGSLLFGAVCFVYFFIITHNPHLNDSRTYVTSSKHFSPISERETPDVSSTNVTCNVIGQDKICQYGSIKNGHKYAIYGSTLFVEPKSINYVFDLPLSALAWKRIGFDSIVYVLGNYEQCANSSQLHYTINVLLELDYVVLLVLEGYKTNQSVTLGQTVRLFTSSMIQNPGDRKGYCSLSWLGLA
jgi:hypothetical protein